MSSWMARVAALAGDAPGWVARGGALVRRVGRALQPGQRRLVAVVEGDGPTAVRVAAYQALVALALAEDPDDPGPALALGESLLPALADSAAAHLALAAAYRRAYAIDRPHALVARARQLGAPSWGFERLADEHGGLHHGLPLSPHAARAFTGQRRRIAYVVASSRPFHTAGYGARSHALVGALRRRDWDVHVLARAGYPSDRWDYPRWALPPTEQVEGGVPYTFAPTRAKLRYARAPLAYHREAADVLEAQCRALEPTVIHAASNYNVGLAACEVGRRLGLPVIYEVRGLWHVSKASAQPRYDGSDHFRMIERFECQAAAAADHAFAITSGVAAVLAAGGVDRARMSLLPNAADIDALRPRPADPALVARHRLAGHLVLGYVGSLNDYEGLDALIAAMPALAARGHAVKALIVGDGPQRGALEAAAQAAGVRDAVIFTGRIAPDAVADYYAAIDLLVLPRRPLPVCELVSPLKPFEAMAMARCVVASDVAALADIVTDGVTGRLFAKGQPQALLAVLDELCRDPAQRARLGEAGGRWVRTARSWDALAAEVEVVYRRLGGDVDSARHPR